MVKYYAFVDVPDATVEEPAGIFRIFRSEGELYAEHVTAEGTWEWDPTLLEDVYGPGVVEISEADARRILARYGIASEAFASPAARRAGIDQLG